MSNGFIALLLFLGGIGCGVAIIALPAYVRAARRAGQLIDLLGTLGEQEQDLRARLEEFDGGGDNGGSDRVSA